MPLPAINPRLWIYADMPADKLSANSIVNALDALGDQWRDFAADTTASIVAVAKAIDKGDLTAARDVARAYFSTVWQRLCNTLQAIWEAYRAYFTEAYYGTLVGWTNLLAKVKSVFAEAIGTMRKLWLEFCNSSFTEEAATLLVHSVLPVILMLLGSRFWTSAARIRLAECEVDAQPGDDRHGDGS